MKPEAIQKVRDRQFLEYPNGEIWASDGEYVYLDGDVDVVRAMLQGQKQRVLPATKEELRAGVKLKPWEDMWVNHAKRLGYKVPLDTEYKLGRAITKAKKKKEEEPVAPAVETEK